jgi:hypothetical protein
MGGSAMSEVKATFKGNIDGKAILSAADRAEQKLLMQFGAYVMRTAKRSIKKGGRGETSSPGEPPVGHGMEFYANFIAFAHDPAKHEVVIGSQLLSGTLGDVAPEKIEYGGTEAIIVGKWPFRKRKVVNYLPRPAMRLAYDVAVKKFLPKLIENSIVP